MISAQKALQRLKDGNHRFVQNIQATDVISRNDGFKVIKEQQPIAIILGCSDARVPAEIIFDQGLGQLFVIRVAGNIVAPSQIGSIEYAAAQCGARLVVVLGHSNCGAIQATLQELERPAENRSPNLKSIVDRIKPSVEKLLEDGVSQDTGMLLPAAVKANVETSVRQLLHGSEILEQLITADQLKIIGAEYSLETGIVEFYDD